MARMVVKNEASGRCPLEYGRVVSVLFWIGFLVALGLAHIHMRMWTRDLDIQASRLQAQSKELWERHSVLTHETSRLREGERMLEYGQRRLGLVALPAVEIEVWKMPRTIAEKSNQVCSEIALARAGEPRPTERESVVARVLGAILSPVQAQPQSRER